MTDPADDAFASRNGAPRAVETVTDTRPSGSDSASDKNSPVAQALSNSDSQSANRDRRPDIGEQESTRTNPEGGLANAPSPEKKKRRRRRSRRGKSKAGTADQQQVTGNASGQSDAGREKNAHAHPNHHKGRHQPDLAHKMRGNPGDKRGNGPKPHSDRPNEPGASETLARQNNGPDGAVKSVPPNRQAGGSNAPHMNSARGNPPLYAALDLGTNNCRLLVALPTRPGQFRVVDAFSRIVRLGEGLGATGRLSEAAMDRAVEALKVCAIKLENRPVRRHRLIATEACRTADNGVEFLERVKLETGLDLEIVDRETEARLAVSGCSSLVGRETDGVVLFDIGGGSSEIAAIDLSGNRSNRLANHITAWTSLPVGVVNLSERHGGQHVTERIYADMVEEVAALLSDFICPALPGCSGAAKGVFHLLGTSGTVTTLAGVHLDLPRYDRRRVDGLWLTSDQVDLMTRKLLSWDFDARSSNPCIGADRADLVLAGCAILDAIRLRWPSERLRVADRGLREGLLTEMMAADGIWRRGKGKRNFYKRQSGSSIHNNNRSGEQPKGARR